ncbi:hypothetical protein DSECCO2_573340 [anaerobic digester metagenome]
MIASRDIVSTTLYIEAGINPLTSPDPLLNAAFRLRTAAPAIPFEPDTKAAFPYVPLWESLFLLVIISLTS